MSTPKDTLKTPFPVLERSNHKLLLINIKTMAEEHNLIEMLNNTPAEPLSAQQRKTKAQATRLIVSNLSAESLKYLADDFFDLSPAQMLAHIKDSFTPATTPAAHEALRLRAEAMKIRARETLDEYFERHLSLRREMAMAGYPLISNETTSVNFMLRGLSARPQLSPYVPTLLLQQIDTIKNARAAVDILAAAVLPVSAATPTRSTPPVGQRLMW